MKCRVLAVCVASLAMLFATLPAVGAPVQESGCATVTIYTMSSTGIVAPGNTIALAGKYFNCSSGRLRFTYKLSAMSSCGQKVDLASGRKTLDPGMARIWSISYTMPSNTCAGPWEATMQLNDGAMASASTTVTVQ
jgi:hypothetical protein